MSDFSFTEPPQFTKEPERHITAEMEKVVQIPCQAKGNFFYYIRDCLDQFSFKSE